MLMGKYYNKLQKNKQQFFIRILWFFSFMNITLVDVVFVDPHGKYHSLANILIAARNIRFIHVPKKVIKLQFVYYYY